MQFFAGGGLKNPLQENIILIRKMVLIYVPPVGTNYSVQKPNMIPVAAGQAFMRQFLKEKSSI